MSQDNSIFQDAGSTQNSDNSAQAGATSNQPDALGTLLAGIKNERGEQKYKTVDDALKALGHSQAHIPNLQQQLEAKNREVEALAAQQAELVSLKETVAKLTEKLTEKSQETPGNSISESDIAEIVGRQLTAKQQEQVATGNRNTVSQAMSKQFGDKAAEVFYGKAQELGMTREQINSLADSSPQAVLTMFGVNGGASQKQALKPPIGTVNTAGFSNTAGKSLIGREDKPLGLGGTDRDVKELHARAKLMVEELEANGMSIEDLTIPSNFFKYF